MRMSQCGRHSAMTFSWLFNCCKTDSTHVHIAFRTFKAGNYAFYYFIYAAHAFQLFLQDFFSSFLSIISRLAWEGSRCVGTVERLGI